MRTRYTTLSLLLTITLVLAACGGAAAPASPAAEAPAAASQAEAPAAALPTTESATEASPAAEPAAAETAATRTFAIIPEQTQASYSVDEEFLGQAINFVTAVGTTQSIDGQISFTVDGSSLQNVAGIFNVDIRTLTSDRPRRDSAIRDRWLESNRYPTATFNATGVSDLPADATLGQPVSFKLSGDMTIREVTNPFTWNVTASLDGNTLTGTAQSFFMMKDFGFDPPSIAGVLKVTDGVTLTVNFTAQETQ